MKRTATISPCGLYRYTLGRVWAPDLPVLGFLMLNPSTADADADDPTIRRCIGFAASAGYGSIEVVNLFAWRATHPADLWLRRELYGHAALVGPENDAAIAAAPDRLVMAWGAHGSRAWRRILEVGELMPGRSLSCLGFTGEGHPRHPLMVPADRPLVPFGWKVKA